MPKRKRAQVADTVADGGQAGTNGIGEASPASTRRKIKEEPGSAVVNSTVRSPSESQNIAAQDDADSLPIPAKRKRKTVGEVKEEATDAQTVASANLDAEADSKVKRKRKTKEEKEAEAMPLAARTVGHKLFIGAHVSGAGGVHNAVVNSVQIGANAFALFLKSQRKWANPPLVDDHCTSFHDNCGRHSYDQGKHVVPHGSYLVNLAHTDPARTDQAFTSFLDDLQRCEKLGIRNYNFHPGVANSTGGDRAAAIKHLASNLNRAHKATSTVITLLENMAAGGNVLGSTFEDLRDIIALVDDKQRVGVCLDTCHAFAGGYDLRTPDAFRDTMDLFNTIVGMRYLRAVHLNDSKAPFASHRDLHANIGTGFLGLRAFHNLVNDARFEGLPLILETPLDATDEKGAPLKDEKGKEKEDRGIWAREIKLLESLVGMDADGDDFSRLDAALSLKGAPERNRLSAQIEKKQEKAKAKELKAKGKKGKAKAKAASEEDDSELSDENI